LLKGYQGWAGRALVGLRAIELCADVIREKGYNIIVHLASPDVILAAEIVAHNIGIPISIVTHGLYEDAMRRFSVARVHLGLSISDGISQSLLESMVMGTFPIQSFTACADEWIEDGKSGFLVPPEDPHIIAEALRRALTDDALVDQASDINADVARQRLAYAHVKAQAVDMYNSVYATLRR
jgi:glycosyltransferase involved in cell wall biosynthesis